MDSFKTFISIFERAVADRNSANLTSILHDGKKYFRNISRDENELFLSVLFDENKGLLHFLQSELNRSTAQKGFDMAIKAGFHLVKFIIEEFPSIFEPYIISTKETCQLALATLCSSLIQKEASNTFIRLIQIFNDCDMDLGETVAKFVSLFPVITIKERSYLLSVLGAIAKNNPEIMEIRENSVKIFQQLRSDFKKQYKPPGTFQPPEIPIYLDILADMMRDLPNEVKEGHREEIYTWIKQLSPPRNHGTKKVTMKSALSLLSSHINLFREFVYYDYKYWYSLLVGIIQEKNAHTSSGQKALRRFYKAIGIILKERDSEADRTVYLYFKDIFERQLKGHSYIDPDMLPLIVYGFSQMAAPCKKFQTDNDVRDMFSLITYCAMPLSYSEDLEQNQLESICHYQKALSKIMAHTSGLSGEQLTVLTKFSIFLVKRFPDLSETSQEDVVSTLINTTTSIGAMSQSHLEEFLYNLIHDGVTWTCSHTLFVDAELQRGMKNLKERPTCYKNYLPLWLQLSKPSKYKEGKALAQVVVDSMIHVCIELIGKLNLNTKSKNDSVFSDAALSQTAKNEADFRVFINIVDLYADVISELRSNLLTNSMYKFLLKVINMSYKHPLISGFYKLVHACFKHVCYPSQDETETEMLLHKYLMRILDLVPTFSNELLITCLHLIIDIPITYVERILNRTIPAFKIIFTIGLSNFELAYAAQSILEKWTSHLENRQTKEFLREIIPYFEPYLQSKGSCAELLQDIVKTERKVVKRIIQVDNKMSLENFQSRILLFIASLDLDVITDFVYKRSMDTGATWDKKDLLKYTLPLSDAKIDICFEKILPRLIALAQNSGDRRIKVIASEVLHTIVAFVFGKTSQYLTSNPERFVTIYATLCPALLNLGCDSDEVVRQIFQPVMLQLTHWFSSKFMLESPATMHLLDSIFEGLSNDSNSSLREFSGICLAEFTRWSIKQSDNEQKTRVNIYAVVRKITNFALHPIISKRVAGAIAFNHLYTILREEEDIVTIYWLEIFYCFVKSLDGCNDPSIVNALDHVVRVLIVKQDLLNQKHEGRRKPHEFEDATLRDSVIWLFAQCGSLNERSRKKCMELFDKLSKNIEDCASPKTMVENFIESRGIETLNHMILKDLKLKMESLLSNSLLALIKSFDCYIWLIRENLVSVEELFSYGNPNREEIFNCAENFIQLINRIKVESNEKEVIILSKELEDVQTLQCKAIITMFDFLEILLNRNENFIPYFFLSADLFEVISKCVICPHVVGIDVKNLEIAETLPSVMEHLLRSITQRMDLFLIHLLKGQLAEQLEKPVNTFLSLDEIVRSGPSIELKQYVEGLIILCRCDMLNTLYMEEHVLVQTESKIELIFNKLSKNRMEERICAHLTRPVIDYLQSMMVLLLMNYQPTVTRTLLNLVANDTMLVSDSGKIAHGVHFLNTFKDVIFEYVLNDPEKTISEFDCLLHRNPSLLFRMVEDLMYFVKRHKKRLKNLTEDVARIFVGKFVMFERAVNNLVDRKQTLINIYGIVVHLAQNPMEIISANEEFYIWILNQLTENSDLEYKVQILQNFLVCLTDMTSKSKPELIAILRKLKADRLSLCPHFTGKCLNDLKVIKCFDTLLTLLPVTRSIAVFETVIQFAAGIGEHLSTAKTNEYLQKYVNCISSEHVVKSLETAYKLFMNLSAVEQERFDVLNKFLKPLFEFCGTLEMREFFERNVKEILTTVERDLAGQGLDMKQLIVTKIGCYDLLAVMFAKIPEKDIMQEKSAITRNAITNVKTGRELTQRLLVAALAVRKLKISDLELKEVTRLLHCAAFNFFIALGCLKEEEYFYMAVFGENKMKGQIIWENIVDCEKQYNLRQTFEEYPKNRQKLVNIRKTMQGKQPREANRYSYICSYNLSTCSLNEDINAYDLNEMSLRDKPTTSEKEERMTLTFECDELNNHECMAVVCGAITHIISNEISVVPEEGSDDFPIPKWLKCFYDAFLTVKADNATLFLFKVVLNVQTVFKLFAKFFFEPITISVCSYLKKNPLNYIITDLLIMLIDWSSKNLCTDNRCKTMIQNLWETMIQKAIVTKTNEISWTVYRYNTSLVKMMLETWQTSLKLPTNLTHKMRSDPGPAVYLILICFDNGMNKELMKKTDVVKFLEKSVENWQNDEKTVLQSFECLGFVLKGFDEDVKLTGKKGALIEKIRSVLRQMQTKCEARQIKCIRAICNSYPEAAMIYFDFVSRNMARVDAMGKVNCLEIFLLYAPSLNASQLVKELGYMKFHDLLKNKILPCERVALKIIDTLTSTLPAAHLLPLIHLVRPFAKHNASEYRESAYSIFMNVYKKYARNVSNDDNVKQLISISKENLLTGLLDPADGLQEKLLRFWTQDSDFANSSKERLVEILNTFAANVGDSFLPFTLLTMLDLAKKSLNYTQKMFLPLHDCSYREYKIAHSWRMKNLGSMAPLFAPSLASQMSQRFTQMSATLPTGYDQFSNAAKPEPTLSRSYEDQLEVRATQQPEFEPTFPQEEPIVLPDEIPEYDDEFKVPKVPQPVHNKKSKRFLNSSSDVSAAIRRKEIQRNIRYNEMIKEEAVRQRTSVKLYRKYRIGDFPDVEISHSNLIEPLTQLAKNDQLICKDLTVSIICSLLEDRSDDFVRKIVERLKHIIEHDQGNSLIVGTVLEILLSTRITDCSPDLIAKVSKANSLNFLGSLVLEESMMYAGNNDDDRRPVKKKPRIENVNHSSDKWLQLSSLYESMNDVDVVLSIFKNHIDDDAMREASLAQTAGDWPKARAAYGKAYESGTELVKEHNLEGLFGSLSNLCSWSEIDKCVKKKLNGDLDNIWNDSSKDSMFPWFFEVEVRKLLDNDISESFTNEIEVIQSWQYVDAKLEHIERFFGEEIAMFLLPNKLEIARDYLANTLDEIRKQWITLHPLSTQLRIRKLEKLRSLNDVSVFIEGLKTLKTSGGIESLLKFWSNSVPLPQDGILPWDKLTSYRLYFVSLCKEIIEENATQIDSQPSTSGSLETGVVSRLDAASSNMRLRMVQVALNQKNKFIAKKYLRQLEQENALSSPDMKVKFLLAGARAKHLNGEQESNIEKKMKYYTSCWKYFHNAMLENDLDPATNITVREHVSRIASEISRLSQQNDVFADLLKTNDIILDKINPKDRNIDSIRESLEAYSLHQLRTSCETTTRNVSECYLTLAKYCNEKLSRAPGTVQLHEEFIKSTLRAMSYGSIEASHYFPCLLKTEYFEDADNRTREIFAQECDKVETWLFLSWQAQLFSHLGTPIGPLIIPILERIVETYPNAVIYTFRLTVETNPALLNDTRTYKIRQILYNNPETEKFLIAMQYLVQPEFYLRHHLSEFLNNLSLGTATAISTLIQNVYPSQEENNNNPKRGNIYCEIARFKRKITQLEQKSSAEIKQSVAQLIESLRESIDKRKDRIKLKDYSPWLQEFSAGNLEIPGQYSGNRKPMPQYHAKIMKIEPTVKVMQSLRKPICITIVGNDAKEYKFLVKFAEDLRLDQRLQQLFAIMNKTMYNDAACRQRQLSIDTYNVVPLSRTLGLIQWIDNTRTLQELINFTLSETQVRQYDSIPKEYDGWMRNAAPLKKQHEQYKEATLKYTASKVIAKMNDCICKTERTGLRRTLAVLSPTVESFVTLRRNFVTSYATMCVAHWILGIGDRHLGNILIAIRSGRCLGIDFGLAFGAGIDLRIPELMPFRLTPQILGLLEPFSENDLLATTMIHALRALRNDQGPILTCMDVFVREPLNWTENLNNAQKESEDDTTDVKWLPNKKIEVVRKKLNGIKPSLITLVQLKDQHNDQYFDRYHTIVTGNDDIKRRRADMNNESLSSEEQVECLLDQATDLNIIGRSFVGWRPWL